jgi:hypothetical protein
MFAILAAESGHQMLGRCAFDADTAGNAELPWPHSPKESTASKWEGSTRPIPRDHQAVAVVVYWVAWNKKWCRIVSRASGADNDGHTHIQWRH